MSALERNNVTISGVGKTIIFIHGYGCDQRVWRHVVPAFAGSYRTVAYDLTGSGQSDLSAYDYLKYRTLDGHASDLLEICDELDLAGSNVVVVAHSVGSMIALLASLRQPAQFSHLAMISPSPRYVDDGDYVGGLTLRDLKQTLDALEANRSSWSKTMAPVLMRNAERPELGHELAESFSRTDPVIAKHFAKVTFCSDYRDEVRKADTPTLILQCATDIVAPIEVGQWLHRNMANSQLIMLGATGHYSHLSAPQETIEAIQTFLAA